MLEQQPYITEIKKRKHPDLNRDRPSNRSKCFFLRLIR